MNKSHNDNTTQRIYNIINKLINGKKTQSNKNITKKRHNSNGKEMYVFPVNTIIYIYNIVTLVKKLLFVIIRVFHYFNPFIFITLVSLFHYVTLSLCRLEG